MLSPDSDSMDESPYTIGTEQASQLQPKMFEKIPI